MDVPRMYTDESRDALARPQWDVSHWVDYVESGAVRVERNRRLARAPACLKADVRKHVVRRQKRRGEQ